MATDTQDYKPQTKPADEVVKQCQEFIRLYPTRFTLTDSALEKIKNTGSLPKHPQNIAEINSDYDLRNLRDGYIYILAAKTEHEDLEITWEADGNNKAWYIYSYRNEDNIQGFYHWNKDIFKKLIDSQTPESTDNNEKHKDLDEMVLKSKRKGYIELNKAITSIHIMYSEFKLPYNFLKELETKSSVIRNHWMTETEVTETPKLAKKLSEAGSIISDLVSGAKYIAENLNNLYRSSNIGKSKSSETNITQLENSKGVIVALDDPIGIARDLDAYVYYLDDKRQEILSKYEYSFVTAQVIDAYATNFQMEEDKKRRQTFNQYDPYGYNENTKMTLEKAYAELNIAKSHLDNSEDSIVKALKKELGITQTIHGINTINKIARLPNLFNDHINNVVSSICTHIDRNTQKIKDLFELYEATEKDESIATLCCKHIEGIIGHLNYTPMGQQALVIALNKENDLVSQKQKQKLAKEAEALKNLFDSFKNFLSSLAAVGNFYRFNLYSFDRIVKVMSNELILSGSYKQNGKRHYKRTQMIRDIEQVYRKTGIFGQDELLSEEQISSHAKKLKASRKKPTNEELIPIRTKRTIGLKIDDSDFKRVTGLSSQFDGAAKLFAFSAIFGFFTEDSSYTKEGRWANDPVFATLLAFAEKVAPESNLAFEFRPVANQRMSLAAVNKATGGTFSSSWQAARAGLFNLGTALAGIGVLIEVANAHEAKYKGDEIDYWGAVSRGIGSGLIALSQPAFGTALTMMASTSVKVAAAGTILRVAAIALPYVGAALLLVGVVLAFFKKTDMELWIEHGFWGDSNNYWGETVGAYRWSEPRDEYFKENIFDHSIFNNQESIEFSYYKLEMQRLFSITEKIKFEVIDKHHIRVIHPNITKLSIAQGISIPRKEIINSIGKTFYVKTKPQIHFNEREKGQAILYFPSWHIVDMLTGELGFIDERDIIQLKIQATLPRYDRSTENIESDLHTLNMAGK